MFVRQIQALKAPRCDLREVRCGSDPDQSQARPHGSHRLGRSVRSHMVLEVTPKPFGFGFGHDPA